MILTDGGNSQAFMMLAGLAKYAHNLLCCDVRLIRELIVVRVPGVLYSRAWLNSWKSRCDDYFRYPGYIATGQRVVIGSMYLFPSVHFFRSEPCLSSYLYSSALRNL